MVPKVGIKTITLPIVTAEKTLRGIGNGLLTNGR